MGHKAFKSHFKIKNHIVSVRKGVLYIGSGFASNLVGIDMQTGGILVNNVFGSFLHRYYPEILNSTDEDRLALIKTPDVFEQSIPVYTFCDGQIVEKQCEQLGFPNVTHDGEVMYENTHYPNKADAIEYARKMLCREIEREEEAITDLETQLIKVKARLSESKSTLEKFQKTFGL